ncbi:S9 family peptidase [Chryseobacterium lactis]|uniref:prolyl oligopeptidase n=1 Tax=Chryseobacterium lactis TaxID=1241981 RepID=A0A3G6RFG3_CHRLC|nr:prolyl oligopeptidase family serine peptidase [Chryseobacterium lactis]AZA82517.1 S9 family peptidase [Chryseobacterium lactis]AZB02898.1 S9 family peptidase [Chryseobacterium lactis]PNW13807.1 S9 family peptidase [Chryseobacterium lactis]
MKYIFLTSCLLASQICFAQYNYPKTAEKPATDDYFGNKITDNYQWLEDLKNPEVKTWFKAQSDYSHSIIDKIPNRDALYNRMKQVQEMGGDSYGYAKQIGNLYFYVKTKKNEKLSKLYTKDISTGKETLVFDPETYKKDAQITNFTIDSKGNQIALLFSKAGSEICELRILDVKTKKFLDDVLAPIWSEFNFEFTPDGKYIIYTKMSTGDPNSNMLLKEMKAMIHQIGTSQDKDIVLGSREEYPELNILTEQFPKVSFTNDYKSIILKIGSTKSENPVFYAPFSSIKDKKIKWKQIIKSSDDIIQTYISGDQLFFLSHRDSPNYKIGLTSLSNPDFDNAKVIVPESSSVITSIHSSKNYLFYSLSNGITQDKYQIDLKTLAIKKVPLPDGINHSNAFNSRENDHLQCYNSNWLTPGTFYDYNPENGKAVMSKYFNGDSSYPDYNALYEVKETEVKSHDGTMVPLSIIYPKNIKMDGNTPAYITGYGGYGISYTPRFSNRLSVLLEQGVILAVAHVRGGGEKGDNWHKDGMKAKKSNTWKDFIACSEYLVSQKYTSPSKLIGNGASMGGVLIGRAITERPDLYGAGIVEVGMTNVLRSQNSANGANQIPEIGSLKNPEDTKYLIEMDAQSKVKKGMKYPAVIVSTGMNDSRITPWEPAKFATVLQNSTSSGKPVLLYANYENGHFTSDQDVVFHEYSDIFAFALWQVGHPKFQPLKK